MYCKPFALLSILLLASLASFAGEGDDLVFGTRLEFESKVFEQKVSLPVILPDGYEKSEQRYPVMYVLNGDWTALLVHTGSAVELLQSQGAVPPAIVVGVAALDGGRDYFPAQKEGRFQDGRADRFLQMIMDEVVPYVEGKYRTAPYRILYGQSNAGLFTLHVLLSRPDAFQAYISSSPMIGWMPQFVEEEARALFAGEKKIDADLFMVYGTDDYSRVTENTPPFAGFLEENAPEGLRWSVKVLDDGGHVPVTGLYHAMRAIFPDWKVTADDALVMGLDPLEKHYEGLAKRYRIPVRVPQETLETMGFRLMQQEKWDESIAALQRCADLYPDSPRPPYLLAAVNIRKGDTEAAIRHLERTLELDPDNQRAAERLKSLRGEAEKEGGSSASGPGND